MTETVERTISDGIDRLFQLAEVIESDRKVLLQLVEKQEQLIATQRLVMDARENTLQPQLVAQELAAAGHALDAAADLVLRSCPKCHVPGNGSQAQQVKKAAIRAKRYAQELIGV